MLYASIANTILTDLGRSTPDFRITFSRLLEYITQARNIIQTRTAVITCFREIDLDVLGDGTYDLKCTVNRVKMAEWRQDDTQPWMRIPDIRFEEMQSVIAGRQSYPVNFTPPIPGTHSLNCPTPVTISINRNILYVYPQATGGTVRLWFVPNLIPYSAGDIWDWAAWQPDPVPMMRITAIEPEFIPAMEGIKAYAKLNLVKSMPNEFSAYAPMIQGWERDVRKITQDIHNVEVQRDSGFPSRLGVIR